ncbi:MAG: hypothetical protein ACLUN0_03270 [Roseburia sp.]
MGIKVQIIILVIIIIALLSLGNMIRKKKVDLRYALSVDYSGLHYACV